MGYLFKKSGNKDFDKLIKIFDKQIKKEYKDANGDKYKCISYWKKHKFTESIDFTLDDWKKIRTEKYWKKINYLQSIVSKTIKDKNKQQEKLASIEVDRFILNMILEYKNIK